MSHNKVVLFPMLPQHNGHTLLKLSSIKMVSDLSRAGIRCTLNGMTESSPLWWGSRDIYRRSCSPSLFICVLMGGKRSHLLSRSKFPWQNCICRPEFSVHHATMISAVVEWTFCFVDDRTGRRDEVKRVGRSCFGVFAFRKAKTLYQLIFHIFRCWWETCFTVELSSE